MPRYLLLEKVRDWFQLLGLTETRQCMPLQALVEQIPIDRLARNGSLSGGDDHLAVRRRHTSRRIESRHGRLQTMVDDDLTVLIQFRAGAFRQIIVMDIASCRECPLHVQGIALLKGDRGQLSIIVQHGADAIVPDRHRFDRGKWPRTVPPVLLR